jgi:hypothetical protein
MMGRGTARNMQSFVSEFVKMHGHVNVKNYTTVGEGRTVKEMIKKYIGMCPWPELN